MYLCIYVSMYVYMKKTVEDIMSNYSLERGVVFSSE